MSYEKAVFRVGDIEVDMATQLVKRDGNSTLVALDDITSSHKIVRGLNLTQLKSMMKIRNHKGRYKERSFPEAVVTN